MNRAYESAKAMQSSVLASTTAKDASIPEEQRLIDLLAFSILDIPMVQRRKEIARNIGQTLGGYLREKLAEKYSKVGTLQMILRQDVDAILDLLDGGV